MKAPLVTLILALLLSGCSQDTSFRQPNENKNVQVTLYYDRGYSSGILFSAKGQNELAFTVNRKSRDITIEGTFTIVEVNKHSFRLNHEIITTDPSSKSELKGKVKIEFDQTEHYFDLSKDYKLGVDLIIGDEVVDIQKRSSDLHNGK